MFCRHRRLCLCACLTVMVFVWLFAPLPWHENFLFCMVVHLSLKLYTTSIVVSTLEQDTPSHHPPQKT